MAKTKQKKNTQKNKLKKKEPGLREWSSNPAIVVILSVIVLFAITSLPITQDLSANSPNVLSDDEQEEEKDENKDEDKETEKKEEEQQKENEKKLKEQQKEATKTQAKVTPKPTSKSGSPTKFKSETTTSSGLKIKTETEEDKEETEIETVDGQKIKTKIEDDGTTKIEIENGTLKLKYRLENGQLVLKAENEDGDEVEIEDDELAELEEAVENELEDEDLKILPVNDDLLSVTKNQTTATTNFPLSVNVETGELIVTTPAGTKSVTVLPDQAVENLLATGIVNKIETQTDDVPVQSELGATNGLVKLEIRNDKMVYKINGIKTHKVLGFIPVETKTTVFVSTDDGEVLAQQRTILTNIVDLLSPLD